MKSDNKPKERCQIIYATSISIWSLDQGLPSTIILFVLKQFLWYSGSTIVGIGSPDPPQFIYDDDDYKDVFISGNVWLIIPSLFFDCLAIISEASSKPLMHVKQSPSGVKPLGQRYKLLNSIIFNYPYH